MLSTQNLTIIDSNQNSEDEAVNERYLDFLKFALRRTIETAVLYETHAKNCLDASNKLFLYFLAGKKRVQHVVLEIIAKKYRNKSFLRVDYSQIKGSSYSIILSDASSEAILEFAQEQARKDLNLYKSLAELEEDSTTRKLLDVLSKLTDDFMRDITAGFSRLFLKKNYSKLLKASEVEMDNNLKNLLAVTS
jgi:hypothetical protein